MKQGNAWNMPLLQIQPRFLHGEQWSELAARKGLYYEPVEFYMPPVLATRSFLTRRGFGIETVAGYAPFMGRLLM